MVGVEICVMGMAWSNNFEQITQIFDHKFHMKQILIWDSWLF